MFARIAALIGFLGVACGTMGAHVVEQLLETNGRAETWDTAVLYHLVHAVVLFVLSYRRETVPKGPWIALALGILLFSGDLYVYSLTNIKFFGFMAMFGGISFLVGWLWLVIKAR